MSNNSKKIKPSRILIDYLNETLTLEKEKREKLIDFNSKKVRNNDEKKVRMIDNLFESMANLTYFFEFVNINPDLINKFVDDIDDLIGLRKHESKDDRRYQPFWRLIKSILGYHGPELDTDNKFYFQRRCMRIMQYAVTQKIGALTNRIKEDAYFKNRIKEEMFNARMWADHFDKEVTGRETKRPKRIMSF
jgi:hypothetical protein